MSLSLYSHNVACTLRFLSHTMPLYRIAFPPICLQITRVRHARPAFACRTSRGHCLRLLHTTYYFGFWIFIKRTVPPDLITAIPRCVYYYIFWAHTIYTSKYNSHVYIYIYNIVMYLFMYIPTSYVLPFFAP